MIFFFAYLRKSKQIICGLKRTAGNIPKHLPDSSVVYRVFCETAGNIVSDLPDSSVNSQIMN